MPKGIVKEVQKDTVIVTLERQDMCGECHACEMLSGKKSCTLTCQTQIECKVGDIVEIELAKNTFLKATYLIYGMPLIGFLVGFLIGYLFNLSELMTGLMILIGTSFSILYIKMQDKKKAYQGFLPYVIKKEPLE